MDRRTMSAEEVAETVEAFARAAARHYEYTETGAGRRKINREADKVREAYRQLRSHEGGKRALLPVLDDANLAVVSMAATYLMHFAPDRSKAALERVAKDPRLLGLEAQYALQRFKDGTWQLEFE
jgi:hypothetical protein